MKKISTSISICITLIFAKLDGIKGGDVSGSIPKDDSAPKPYPFKTISIPGFGSVFFPGIGGGGKQLCCPRVRRRHLVTDECLWSSSEIEICLEDIYDTKL